MVAEVVHGAPCRFADPARFSLAHGGKDRQPFPVPIEVYDRTIEVLKNAVARAKLGNEDRLDALRRLDEQTRRLEWEVEQDLRCRSLSPRKSSARTRGPKCVRLGAGACRQSGHASGRKTDTASKKR
jgi:hypothetical protein